MYPAPLGARGYFCTVFPQLHYSLEFWRDSVGTGPILLVTRSDRPECGSLTLSLLDGFPWEITMRKDLLFRARGLILHP